MKHIEQSGAEWIDGKGYRKKILLREDDLNSPGTLVQIVEIAPETKVAEHYHQSCTEVFHILSGKGSFDIGKKTFHLEKGDTLTCEPLEIHATRNPYREPFRYLVFKTNVKDGDLFWV